MLRAPGASFLGTLDRALFAGLGGRRGAFFAFFLLLFDHLDLARDSLGGGGQIGGFLFLRARRGDSDDRDMLVPDDLGILGRFDLAQVNGLANLEMANVHRQRLRQILGQGAHLELEQHVLQRAAVGLDAFSFAGRLERHQHGDLFVFGHLVEINVQHLAREGMVLDFLHQRQPLGPGIILDRQVHQEILGDGMVDEVPISLALTSRFCGGACRP